MAGEASHYEVALTDQLPPPVPKTVRLAARISHLPMELVEPIIMDLPLFRVLEILAVPTCGPSLAAAIEFSPTWSWLFKGHMTQLRRTWASLNRLSWLWCRKKYICVPALQHHYLRSSSWKLQSHFSLSYRRDPDLALRAKEIRRTLDYRVLLGLRQVLGADLYNARPSAAGHNLYLGFSIPQIRALCIFLPAPILYAIRDRSAIGLREALLTTPMPQSAQDCLREAEDGRIDFRISTGDLSRREMWTLDAAHRFLPFLTRAYELLKEAYSRELLFTAELYEQFPGKLKPPFAPQMPPRNPKHVVGQLRRDAQRVLRKPLRSSDKIMRSPNSKEVFSMVGSYRFRCPDTNLVPFNWCFILFQAIRRHVKSSNCAVEFPEALVPSLAEVQAGLRMIYQRTAQERFAHLLERTDTAGMPNIQRLDAILQKHRDYAPFLHYVSGAPRPLRELSWLKSFLVCVEWMEREFRTLAAACRTLGECNSSSEILDLGSDVLFPPADLGRFYRRFAEEAPADVIARCIQRDAIVCDEAEPGLVPSTLVLHLPAFSSTRGREIAKYLLPSVGDVGIEAEELRYDSLREKIETYLRQAPTLKGHEDGYKLACERADDAMGDITFITSDEPTGCTVEAKEPSHVSPGVPETDVDIASRVLRTLLESSLQPGASATDALDMLRKLSVRSTAQTETIQDPSECKVNTWDEAVERYLAARPARSLPGNDGLPRCYICRLALHVPHKTCRSMCVPCGDFNLAGSELSMPGNLDLSGKTALVTGARVNLGFHVALRLLRCGARVIVSTRYPRDAVARYEGESDSSAWIARLRVVGVDFRAGRDAFDLVRHTRSIIADWGGRLDILINNAAQTLTDTVAAENQAVQRERLLQGADSLPTPLLQSQQYEARVRGGGQALVEGPASDFSRDMAPADNRSSWAQSLADIPYEDVISAHSVNTFVPLILIRELLPLMGGTPTPSPSPPPPQGKAPRHRPAGYIVNVSSREGIFETSRGGGPHKAGKHVHTNMSKAALNMITETEAGPAWARRRVAMNTVDPGYMSAAPELEEAYRGVRPVGWEDGAGRVLWPVAIGEGNGAGLGGGAVWGRFLKHYGAVRVEPGWGRG